MPVQVALLGAEVQEILQSYKILRAVRASRRLPRDAQFVTQAVVVYDAALPRAGSPV
jgi:hypothetical protein